MSVCLQRLKKALAASASFARFKPFSSLISIIQPLVMVSTFSLSPLAKENESLNHFPLMVLKKVLFPIPCGPGKVSTLSNLQPQ